MLPIVEKRPVNTPRLSFQNWAFPEGRQNSVGLVLSQPLDQIARYLQVAPVWKDNGEFIIGGLENAEGRV